MIRRKQDEPPAPLPAPRSRTEHLLLDVRQMPIFRQLVPQEAGVGWPLPLRRHDTVYAVLPFFGLGRGEKGQTPLFPPFATLTLEWATRVPVKYLNLRFEGPLADSNVSWDQPIGTFPHPAVAGLTVGQYQQKRSELLALYDELFRTLTNKDTFSEEWKSRFGALLRLLMEPALLPFYRRLAPNPGFLDQHLGTPLSGDPIGQEVTP